MLAYMVANVAVSNVNHSKAIRIRARLAIITMVSDETGGNVAYRPFLQSTTDSTKMCITCGYFLVDREPRHTNSNGVPDSYSNAHSNADGYTYTLLPLHTKTYSYS
jgi:hypothetical protein